MLELRNERKHFAKGRPAALALMLLLTSPLAIGAQQAPAGDKPAAGGEVVTVAAPGPLARLLPGSLAGRKATSELKQVARDRLSELVADKAAIYQEYLVSSAVSREYSGARVDVFETRNQFAALGLFSFNCGAAQSWLADLELGSGGAQLDGELLFWKGNFFVRVTDANQKPDRGRRHESLARAIADTIVPAGSDVARPPLLDSLPVSLPGVSLVPQSRRYFLGPESLTTFIAHGREIFEFVGDTEAVAGEYTKGEGDNGGGSQGKGSDQTSGRGGGGTRAAAIPIASPMKLVIVECHTPEFATDEMARVTSYFSSLLEGEQQQIVFKRTGNYIVTAVNVRDREFAEGLVNSVQYPYTVKWLRNPLWPTNDPFRMQKTADMLLSTFGLLGLILLTVMIGGTVFGTTVFLKRRKQQQEVFSDAGGMLRLDIEPFALALPPKRSEE